MLRERVDRCGHLKGVMVMPSIHGEEIACAETWRQDLYHGMSPSAGGLRHALLLLSRVWLSATCSMPGRLPCPSPSPRVCSSLLKLRSMESMMLSNHLILCHPLLLLPLVFPSIRVFSSESALLIRWPKYWSFSFSISPSSEYLGLISFRID